MPQNTALLLMAFVCATIHSCASKKDVTQNATIEETNPKLIFLNYKISEDSKGKKNIQFINKIITDGKLKKNIPINNGVSGDLICHQLDKNLNVLQSITIKNPLVKNFEYVDDSKQFQRKEVVLKEAEFSLKLKLEPNTKYFSINEITSLSSKPKLLIKTKIKSL
ncbi:hypothetical protein [Hwangdonia lutea]|uniref:Uncharacterized protein n=1 Tax=Hwangdonia lutea TaxID=3075823 RepID=A0AA97EIX9_9FLAO|nr:hypothetical protein [Hwangdonia sp. SCSIO 19198]WOD42296.1 hypothetical protein RNZ46_09830 [Hwangdonia sp. SCSIO 19198]